MELKTLNVLHWFQTGTAYNNILGKKSLTTLDSRFDTGYTTCMENELNIVMVGPCSEESEAKPALNDTVAVPVGDGRVRIMTITGAIPTPDGTVLYASGGEKVALTDCYLLYTQLPAGVE